MLVPILTQQSDIAEARMNLCIGKSFGWNISLASSVYMRHLRSCATDHDSSFFTLLPHCSRLLGGLL